MTAPITLAEAKENLRLEADDTSEDTLITTLIAAASAQIEAVGVVCGQREETFSLEGFDASIILPLAPVDIATVAISYLDSDGVSQELTGFRVATMAGLARIYPPSVGWPSTLAVTITATVGYADGAVPGNVKAIALLLVGHWYANREAVVIGGAGDTVPMTAQWLLDTISVRRA